MDRNFNEDLTRQLNAFTRGVADELSEKIDNKILDMSRPSGRKTCTITTPPTADSASSAQADLPCSIEDIPGAKFRSNFITVEFGPNGDASIRPLTARSNALTELGLLKISYKGLMTLLNQDLSSMLGRCVTHGKFHIEFNMLKTKEDQAKWLKAKFGDISTLPGQWVRQSGP